MKPNRLKILVVGFIFCVTLFVHAAPPDDARDGEMRNRYETVLLKNPFQERAFNQVYEGYAKVEGVDKWIEALKPKVESADGLSALLLLGQIYDRQFKMTNAIAAFESAAQKGESRPAFKVLLGTLYYKAGQDEKAAGLLGASLDSLTDLDQRAAVCRMLGNLYLRQGKRDQAIAVWKRISEQNPNEIFSQLELAEIYEDNRMWTNAISVYRQIATLSKEDPYRHCRALRSIGQCQVLDEKFKDAIATYEEALELVAPGNWLFEDLKLRLVGVYEDIGDLNGLVKYINAKLEQNPGDVEFRDLLAETYTRMAKFDDADKQYRLMLERNPRSGAVYEKLIALHTRTGKKEEV
ncbi:MAG: tetratricopeptide repeat protein, partial [Verrucomicrobiota bacterium]